MCNTLATASSDNLAAYFADIIMGAIYTNVIDTGSHPTTNITDELMNGFHGLDALRSNIADVKTDVDSVFTQDTNNFNSLQESLENTEDQATTAATNSTTLLTGVSALVIGSAVIGLAKVGSGSLLVSLAQLLANLVQSPPYALLHQASPVAITNGATIIPPNGSYGMILNFTVPATWGRLAGNPITYLPSICRYTWGTADGPLEDPRYITTTPAVLYPFPPIGDRLTAHMSVGITGTYTLLQLI